MESVAWRSKQGERDNDIWRLGAAELVDVSQSWRSGAGVHPLCYYRGTE